MRSRVTVILCLISAPAALAAPAPGQRGTEMAELHPQLVWQRVSPTLQKPEGPVLYQIQLTLGQPNTVPKYDSSGRHFTASQILDNGTTVAIGGFSVNGATGIVTFASGQTFPASGFPAPGGDVSGTFSTLKVVGLQTIPVSGVLPTNGQVLEFNGSNWGPATLASGNGGTVTSIAAGAGLAASPSNPITAAGTLSIGGGAVTNAMLANSSLIVASGSGLSGGGSVALGGSTTLSIGAAAVTNAMLQNPSVTISAGSGLSGGGALALGNSITLNNTGLLSLGVSAPLASTGGQTPTLSLNTVDIAHGGTGITSSGAAGNFLRSNGTAWVASPIQASDLPALSGTYVDLSSNQSIGGNKTFTGSATFNNLITGSISGNAATATTAISATTASNALALGGNAAASYSTTAQNDIRYLKLSGGTLTGGLNGTAGTFSGAVSAGTLQLPATAAATTVSGANSGAESFSASVFNSSNSTAQNQTFLWQAEPTAGTNNTAAPSSNLNLLFSGTSNGFTPTETGLSVAQTGIIKFAAGQTFPGTGAVTSVSGTAPVTVTSPSTTPNISIAAGGITNGLLANPSLTVSAGSGLTGGGSVALGGTTTLSVGSGAVTNAMLANSSVTINTGNGLSGGGAVALGGTLSLANTGLLSLGVSGPIGSTGGQNPNLSLNTVPIANGGTGITTAPVSAGQFLRSAAAGSWSVGGIQAGDLPSLSGTYVDLSTNQSVGGNKTFTGTITFNNLITGNISGNAATATSATTATNALSLGGNAASTYSTTAQSDARYLQLAGGTMAGAITFAGGQNFPNVLSLTGGTLTGPLSGTSANFSSTGNFGGTLTLNGGSSSPATGTATPAGGFNSHSADLVASAFNTTAGINAAQNQTFRWQAESVNNNQTNASGSLNLLFGSGATTPAETGLSIANNGKITFASGQTFPSVVTSVASGAGLTGGPITSSGTISVATGGITNTMLANPSLTVTAGSGLTGGGTVALGSSTTLSLLSSCASGQILKWNGAAWACAADANSGGTVTSISTSGGLTGGPISTSGTISIAANGVTNAMLQNSSLTLTAGTGVTGGGAVALGGSTTLNLDTTFTDSRYAAFSGNTNYIQNLSGGTQPSASFNVSGNGAVGGTFALPGTTSSTVGVLTLGGASFLNAFGSHDTFVGSGAGNFSMTTSGPTFSHANTGLGFQTLKGLTTGGANIAVGELALPSLTTGNSNIAIGQNAGQNLTSSESSDIYVDNLGVTGESNTIRIGTSQTQTFIAGAIHGDGSTLNGVLPLAGGTMTGNITFAGTQTFPGSVTSVAAGDGSITIGGTPSAPTVAVAAGGVTNAMLASASTSPTANSVALRDGSGNLTANTFSGNASTATTAGNVTGIVAIANGGTGSGTKNFVDLSTSQSIGGNKTFSATTTLSGTANLNGPVFFNNTVSFSPGTLLSFSGGTQYPPSSVANSGGGVSSPSEEFIASAYNGTVAQNQRFHWQADATDNGQPNASGALNLSFAAVGNTLSNVLGIDHTGKIATYGGTATHGNGVASVVATYKTTGQTNPINDTTLFTPTADGLFRISAYGVVTASDGSGAVAALALFWTDDDQVQAGGFTGFSNLPFSTAGAFSQGTFMVEGKSGTPIGFRMQNTGTPATGTYSLYITVEQVI